jgi:hypothetical protein
MRTALGVATIPDTVLRGWTRWARGTIKGCSNITAVNSVSKDAFMIVTDSTDLCDYRTLVTTSRAALRLRYAKDRLSGDTAWVRLQMATGTAYNQAAVEALDPESDSWRRFMQARFASTRRGAATQPRHNRLAVAIQHLERLGLHMEWNRRADAGTRVDATKVPLGRLDEQAARDEEGDYLVTPRVLGGRLLDIPESKMSNVTVMAASDGSTDDQGCSGAGVAVQMEWTGAGGTRHVRTRGYYCPLDGSRDNYLAEAAGHAILLQLAPAGAALTSITDDSGLYLKLRSARTARRNGTRGCIPERERIRSGARPFTEAARARLLARRGEHRPILQASHTGETTQYALLLAEADRLANKARQMSHEPVGPYLAHEERIIWYENVRTAGGVTCRRYVYGDLGKTIKRKLRHQAVARWAALSHQGLLVANATRWKAWSGAEAVDSYFHWVRGRNSDLDTQFALLATCRWLPTEWRLWRTQQDLGMLEWGARGGPTTERQAGRPNDDTADTRADKDGANGDGTSPSLAHTEPRPGPGECKHRSGGHNRAPREITVSRPTGRPILLEDETTDMDTEGSEGDETNGDGADPGPASTGPLPNPRECKSLPTKLSRLTVPKLKEALQNRGQSTEGKKVVLVDRLRSAIDELEERPVKAPSGRRKRAPRETPKVVMPTGHTWCKLCHSDGADPRVDDSDHFWACPALTDAREARRQFIMRRILRATEGHNRRDWETWLLGLLDDLLWDGRAGLVEGEQSGPKNPELMRGWWPALSNLGILPLDFEGMLRPRIQLYHPFPRAANRESDAKRVGKICTMITEALREALFLSARTLWAERVRRCREMWVREHVQTEHGLTLGMWSARQRRFPFL